MRAIKGICVHSMRCRPMRRLSGCHPGSEHRWQLSIVSLSRIDRGLVVPRLRVYADASRAVACPIQGRFPLKPACVSPVSVTAVVYGIVDFDRYRQTTSSEPELAALANLVFTSTHTGVRSSAEHSVAQLSQKQVESISDHRSRLT